jgi:hypothetical protein
VGKDVNLRVIPLDQLPVVPYFFCRLHRHLRSPRCISTQDLNCSERNRQNYSTAVRIARAARNPYYDSSNANLVGEWRRLQPVGFGACED